MAICAIAVLQPDGSYLLGLDPSVTNPATCAYVVETGAESVIGSLGSLSVPDATLISACVFALWATAWGVKQVIRVLMENENVQD